MSPITPLSWPASRTLQRLRRGRKVVVEVWILDHEIAGDDRKRELEFDLRLTSWQDHLLRFVPHLRFVSQLYNRLNKLPIGLDNEEDGDDDDDNNISSAGKTDSWKQSI